MKLQEAYAAETNALGNWASIGYKASGGTNFTYAGGNIDSKLTCAEGYTYDDNAKKCQKSENGTYGAATSSTNNFTYTDASGWSDNTIALATGATGFSASNKAKLNDCGAAANWKIAIAAGSAAGEATFTPSTHSANCIQLTPNWKMIGK